MVVMVNKNRCGGKELISRKFSFFSEGRCASCISCVYLELPEIADASSAFSLFRLAGDEGWE